MNTNKHEFLLEPRKAQNTRKNMGWGIAKFLRVENSSAFSIYGLKFATENGGFGNERSS